MDNSQWLGLLRGKLRKIPLSQRRVWTDSDLLAWASKLREDAEVVMVTGPLPPFDVIRGICRDLIGEDAPP